MKYGVFTVPAGQTPAKLLITFKRKRDAIAWAKRETYLQVIGVRK